ncbi:MAG: glycosyltransferase family 4 protein [Xanthobacter sp.]
MTTQDSPSVPADTQQAPARKKALIVVPSVTRFDAISTSVCETFHALSTMADLDVKITSWRCDVPGLNWKSAGDLSDLLLDDDFLDADLIIYHFGIHVNLFDAMVMGNGHARQAVFFHNVTPARFVPEANHGLIAKSLRQMENFRRMDEIWPVSQVNADELHARDFDSSRIHIIPLAVNSPALMTLASKAAPQQLELLFVGRVVHSKGVLDLIAALRGVVARGAPAFRLRIVGNLDWSDRAYLEQVKDAIAEARLQQQVEIVGTASDEELEQLYHQSHMLVIPSYHEGFCKPVIEGLRAGLIPVGYDAYNLRYIANGLGRMSPAGDIARLEEGLLAIMQALPAAFADPQAARLPLDQGLISLAAFDEAARTYIGQFTLDRFQRNVAERARRLLDQPTD